MYLINKKQNNLEEIQKVSFKEAGFKEKGNLQEWIVKNPDVFGEDLLIIQKEFSKFDNTSERIDLLAIDKNGNLVVIENKLDDTGRDVVWQALKYASYCSSLNSQGIKDIFNDYLDKYKIEGRSDEILEDFLGEDYEDKLKTGTKQRIILVAGEFRKEATSTVLWLIGFGLKIQCFHTTPYKLETDKFILDFDQIIPPPEAEDYMVNVAIRNREEEESEENLGNRYSVRLEYWAQFLKEINSRYDYCKNVNPTRESWIPVALGMASVGMNFVISRNYARVEIMINRGDKILNKETFDFFEKQKEIIEQDFGDALIWERMDNKVTSRIKFQVDGVNVFNKNDWDKMNKFMIDVGYRMKKAFTKPIENLRRM